MRLKMFLGFLLVLSWPPLLFGQLVEVSGTITDPNGFVYRNGSITAKLVISNTPFFLNGAPYSPPSEPTRINDDGHFVMRLADVNQLTPPGGTWSFHVCSAQGTIQPGSPITAGPVCFDVTGVIITGTTQNIGALLSAAAPPLTSPPLEGGGGVTSINGQKGAFTFSGAGVTCGGLLCTFGGAAGAGTVGAGTAGQYAIYSGPNTVVGTPNLGESTGAIRASIPIAVSANATPAFAITDPGIGNALLLFSDGGANQTAISIITGGIAIGGIVSVPNLKTNVLTLPAVVPAPTAGTNQLGANSSNVLVYSPNGAAYDFLRPIDFNGTPTSGTLAGSLNFNSITPAAPANGKIITFATSGNSVSASLIGDGSANCLSGQGTYVPCSGGGGGGVTSINTVAGAFSFVGSGVSCSSTTCTFTGTGTGIGGSGTAPFIPVFTGPSSLGNSPITASPSSVIFGSPGPLTPSSTATLTAGIKVAVNQSTGTCANGNQIPLNPTSSVGCAGMDLLFNTTNGTNSGTNAGLIVRSNGASNVPGVLGMGIASIETSSANMPEQRAGYFEADSGQFTGVITTSRGLFAVAVNSSGNVVNNEGLVAQSGVIGSGTNTNDFSMHCLAPLTGGVMTTHACVKIETQGAGNGVEFQTGAHVFSNLPTCTAAYEGSLAAISDSTVTGGTITGGGSNHVLGFCNGSAWTVSGGGGGGGGGGGTGLAQVCAVPSTLTWATNTGNLNFCSFSIPAQAHAYILRCVAQMDVTQGAGQTTDLDTGVNLTTAPATATKFMATYRDPGANQIFLYDNLLSAATGSQNLVIHSVSNSVTSVSETFDGVLNLPAVAQTLNVYVGTSLAGIGGNLLAGTYCMLD